MDSAANAVMMLSVKLGELVELIRRSLPNVAHGAAINNVPHMEPLDSLVLRRLATTSVADDELAAASPPLPRAAVVSSLDRHLVVEGGMWRGNV